MDEADRDCLADMVRYAELASRVLGSGTVADLESDEPKLLSLLHAIQIIGEAANRASAGIRTRNSDIPWQDVIGMRHRVVHDYRRIRIDIVVRTIRDDLPPLIAALKRALEED